MTAAFVLGNYAQSTCSSPISASAASIQVASSAAFVQPGANQQGAIRIDDTGNPNWNQITGPFEIVYQTNNNTSTNTFSGLLRGQEGTSAKAFLAGATISQGLTQGILNAFPGLLMTAPGPNFALPPTQYGLARLKIDEQVLTGSAQSMTIPGTGSLPTGFRHLRIRGKLRSSVAGGSTGLFLRMNGDITSTYSYQTIRANSTSATGVTADLASSVQFDALAIPGNTATANQFGVFTIDVYDYNSLTDQKEVNFSGFVRLASGTNMVAYSGGGIWQPASIAAVTSITLFVGSGNISGLVTTEGIP